MLLGGWDNRIGGRDSPKEAEIGPLFALCFAGIHETRSIRMSMFEFVARIRELWGTVQEAGEQASKGRSSRASTDWIGLTRLSCSLVWSSVSPLLLTHQLGSHPPILRRWWFSEMARAPEDEVLPMPNWTSLIGRPDP